MPKSAISILASLSIAGVVASTLAWPAPAQNPSASYPTVAPLAQYLIPSQSSEIALARTAAPASISGAAKILVLGPDGYTTAVKGTNGFVCLVERSWGKDTADPEFWNPRVRAPHCLNAPAARTYLPIVLMKTRLVLAAKSKMEIAQALKSAWDRKEFLPLDPNAICYMMSQQQYLSDSNAHWHPHMMWYVPGNAVQTWGAQGGDVPVYAAAVPEDHMTIFMIPVDRWSDGTPAMH